MARTQSQNTSYKVEKTSWKTASASRKQNIPCIWWKLTTDPSTMNIRVNFQTTIQTPAKILRFFQYCVTLIASGEIFCLLCEGSLKKAVS